MKDMLDKILQIEKKYNELGITLSDPAVIQDYNRFKELSKQRKSMEETVELYYAWKKAVDAIDEAKELIKGEASISVIYFNFILFPPFCLLYYHINITKLLIEIVTKVLNNV